MTAFELLVNDLRATWATAERDQAAVLNAALDLEVAEFKVHRASIEQAKGVLMQVLSVDADHAFAVLRRYSQQHNVKLRFLAERLVQAATDRQTPRRDESSGALDTLLSRLADDQEVFPDD